MLKELFRGIFVPFYQVLLFTRGSLIFLGLNCLVYSQKEEIKSICIYGIQVVLKIKAEMEKIVFQSKLAKREVKPVAM